MWYPSREDLSKDFKKEVGSYMCNTRTTTSICLGQGAGNKDSTAILGSTAVLGSRATAVPASTD
jgi:hypothetical protein